MNKDKLVAFRTSEEERQMLDIMGKMEDRSKSYIIRQSIREAFYKRKLRLPNGTKPK